jgi:type VI secretion system protein ImpB
MASDSLQHKLDRVRRPRVQITYDVETNGAMQKIELPFVVGVLADLSGKPKQALKPLKERKVVSIDRDNFNDVLAKQAPRLALKVDNRLQENDTKLAVELNFKHIDDFEPARVAEQVGPLKELLDMRNRLTQLMSKMEGNDKLEELLGDVLANTEKAAALAQEMGINVGGEASATGESGDSSEATETPTEENS